MDANKYRNCINKLNFLGMDYFKQLRKSKRWIILNKEPFAIFSLFSIFAMTFIISNIIIAIGLTYSLVNLTRIIFFFICNGSFHQ